MILVPRAAFAVLALSMTSMAQTITIDETFDLFAVIDVLPDGWTIEIASDATFMGESLIVDRSIRIEAAPGFRPTLLRENPGAFQILDFKPGGTGSHTIELVGLDIGVYDVDNFNRHITIDATGTGNHVMHIEDCRLGGLFSVFSSSSATLAFTCLSSENSNNIVAESDGTSALTLDIDSTQVGRAIFAIASNQGSTTLDLADSEVGEISMASTASTSQSTGVVRRCFAGGISAAHTGGLASCVVTNTWIRKDDLDGSPDFGLKANSQSLGTAFIDARNCTVSGFGIGAESLGAGSTVLLTNNVLVYNAIDVDPAIPVANVNSTYIAEDPGMSYVGMNGNLTGPLAYDFEGRLITGSVGIDAGDNAVVAPGEVDLYGRPRIQDSDGNGVATVSMGAVEAVSCASALIPPSATSFAGGNPDVYASANASVPGLGQVWESVVDHSSFLPTAAFDVFGISLAPASVPTAFGTVLIDSAALAQSATQAAGSIWNVRIPTNCAFIGTQAYAQVLSVDPVGASLLTNRLDVVIGYPVPM